MTFEEKVTFILAADCRDRTKAGEAVTALLEVIKEGYSTNYTWYDGKETTFIRGRVSTTDQPFKQIKDLWYPPAEITRANRANAPKSTIFYCSNNIPTALAELRPKLGELITLFEAKANKAKILVKPIEELYFFEKINLTEKQMLFEAFLYRLYQKTASTPRDYYLTAAFASFILHFGKFDGIMYRSFATQFKDLNFAFTTGFADQHMQPFACRSYRVTEYRSPLDFKVQCLFYANKIYKNGRIKWMAVTDCPEHEISDKNWATI
jgi:hypothetical protein